MTGGPGESWQEREARRSRIAQEARQLDREPAGWPARLLLALATVAWLATLVWLALTLPEQVPTHWSSGGTPDGWSSKASALLFVTAIPLLLFYPLIWLSRLVIVWPQAVNTPHKEWWLERPRRLVRFERLVREDLMVIVAVSLLLMVGSDLIIGYAAHEPGGTVPGWWFPALLVAYLLVLGVVMLRMMGGPRYRPDDTDPGLT
ncbi:DUF1648 domain-containing protein [Ornithinimicrobium sufpigmenti]|uniref:DUF1648 domain-containing protein n=1 Tax=Ornithinimicrobium sufpigmenti TaxID=2508882 RepID=UPI00103667A5|nr:MULTISPECIES: DUF1648 domain-containing protein [unclassified Ornithinimicrobium]